MTTVIQVPKRNKPFDPQVASGLGVYQHRKVTNALMIKSILCIVNTLIKHFLKELGENQVQLPNPYSIIVSYVNSKAVRDIQLPPKYLYNFY